MADAEEAVATGACVQAAAVALGLTHADVVGQWGLGATLAVDASPADPEVRSRYAATRNTTYPE